MRRRLLAVAATALLPALVLLAYNEIVNRQQRSAEVHSQVSQMARLISSETQRILEGARSLLVAVSALPAVADLDPENCRATLKRLTGSLTMTGSILVVDVNGKLVCDSDGNAAGIDFSDRGYFKEGLAAKDMVVGEYTISKLTQRPVLPVSIPLVRDGRTIGVVATGIRLDWLQARVTDHGVAHGSAVTIADRKGTILARQPFSERFVGTPIPDQFRYLLTSPRPGALVVHSQDGTERVMGYQPITPDTPLYVSAGYSKTEAFAAVNRTTLTGLATLVFSTVLAFAASSYVGRRFVLRPIDRITTVLDEWKRGNTASRTHMTEDSNDLSRVGSSLDKLLDELDRRRLAVEIAEERRNLLSRELTHRVKNTLSIVSALARQTFKGPDPRVASFTARLTALGRAYDLLLAEDSQGANIGDIIRNTLASHDVDNARRFRIEGPFHAVDPELGLGLSLVIHELGTNATKYGALSNECGYISINWRLHEGRLELSWEEYDGPPVNAPDKEGFGSKLIRRAFPAKYQPQVSILYPPDGLRFCLSFTRSAISPES
ncbi:sensor histidine kinase [Agrobacterium sp. CG674]